MIGTENRSVVAKGSWHKGLTVKGAARNCWGDGDVLFLELDGTVVIT